MTIFTRLLQLVQRFHPQRPRAQTPADLEAGAQPLVFEVHNHIRDWAKIMVTFCLATAPAITLTYAQVHSKYSPINLPRALFRILIMLCFLLRQQIHEVQVSYDSPSARPCWCLLCSDSLLHSHYNSTSSVAINYRLAGLCHFLRRGFSFHSLVKENIGT
jgi:hypothetical protein